MTNAIVGNNAIIPSDTNVGISAPGRAVDSMKSEFMAANKSVGFQMLMSMHWGSELANAEEKARAAVDTAQAANEKYRKFEEVKNKIDIVIADLATKPTDQQWWLIPQDIMEFLWAENPMIGGKPFIETEPWHQWKLTELKSFNVDINRAGAAYGDKNTENNMRIQQAMTNYNASVEGAKGHIKQTGEMIKDIISNTYRG